MALLAVECHRLVRVRDTPPGRSDPLIPKRHMKCGSPSEATVLHRGFWHYLALLQHFQASVHECTTAVHAQDPPCPTSFCTFAPSRFSVGVTGTKLTRRSSRASSPARSRPCVFGHGAGCCQTVINSQAAGPRQTIDCTRATFPQRTRRIPTRRSRERTEPYLLICEILFEWSENCPEERPNLTIKPLTTPGVTSRRGFLCFFWRSEARSASRATASWCDSATGSAAASRCRAPNCFGN